MSARDDLVLCWPDPGGDWLAGLPVGNGRLGAMIFGDAARAVMQLNDATVWSGTPSTPHAELAAVLARGAGPGRLQQVRAALRAGDHERAEELLRTFEGRYTQEFLPLAQLAITARHACCAYRGRTLNLDTAVAAEQVTIDGHDVVRHTWASAADGVVCTEIIAEGPVDLRIEIDSPLRTLDRLAAVDRLALDLLVPVDGAPLHEPDVEPPLTYVDAPVDGYDPFATITVAVDTDGTTHASGDALSITGLTRLLVTVATATSAEQSWRAGPAADLRAIRCSRADLRAVAMRRATGAARRGAAMLLRRHLADQRPLLGAGRLRLGTNGARVDIPRLLQDRDPALLATVLYHWGRYLLVAASRHAAGPPANLQGIWNGELRPPWSSNYTINVNTEMNYWAAEPTGLPEVHLPLVDLLDRIAHLGRDVAGELYGCRGWVAHHNSDIWGWALPVGNGTGSTAWSMWTMGGAWLVQHVWDHYDFGRDESFLAERGWPLLRGCAQFLLDWLVASADGRFDTLPSTSPENYFLADDGAARSVTRSSTIDLALIRATFERSLAAADALHIDDEVCAEIRAVLPRLRRPAIDNDGRLKEWADDLPEEHPQHRHLSPLIGLYPLDQIDPDDTPELAAAAARLLDRRGPGAMGWSWAWKIALRARLGDGETAAELLDEASRPYPGDPRVNAAFDGAQWGGLLPNLLSTHPPFQIDANYGLTAAIVEMLVQSHRGIVRLLPALPQRWPDGAIDGVRARGGITVSLRWSAGLLTAAHLIRTAGDDAATVPVVYLGRRVDVRVPYGATVDVAALFEPGALGATRC